MSNNKNQVLFYSEKLMRDGKMHYSICCYSTSTGEVTYPSDYMDLF